MTSDAPRSFRRRPRLGRSALAIGIGLSVSVGSILVLAPAAQAQEAASSTVLFVVDTSGSMSGTPLDQAKQALHDGIDSLGPSQAAGLRAYGGSCGDGGDLLVPIAAGNASDLNAATDQLSAGGGTPTPEALQAAGADLPSSGNRTIVFISDGQSSCGDPCPVARQLSEDLGVDFKVHAVGFNAPDAAETELSCIAEATGGDYFTATNTAELSEAISTAVEEEPETNSSFPFNVNFRDEILRRVLPTPIFESLPSSQVLDDCQATIQTVTGLRHLQGLTTADISRLLQNEATENPLGFIRDLRESPELVGEIQRCTEFTGNTYAEVICDMDNSTLIRFFTLGESDTC